jgi:hypothetical protein
MKRLTLTGSLLVAATAFFLFGAGAAFAGEGGPAHQAGTLDETTQASVDRAAQVATSDCKKADGDAKQRDDAAAKLAKAKTPAQIAAMQALLDEKTATAAASAADCAFSTVEAAREAASLAGVNGGIESDTGIVPLAEVHQGAAGIVKSDNMDWISNSRGINGALSGANFMHYENLGYDFMFGDGTGGLSIWSLKDPEHPAMVGALRTVDLLQPADSHGPADTATRYWEGENMTLDPKRKLVYLARDPRSFGNSQHPNGRTGLYTIDVKDPSHPTILSYHWVPAGHTATCVNDCRYVWSMGPANNGSHVTGQPQDIAGVLHPEWTGVPVFVTDVRDPLHPYTYANPVDMKRNNNTTAYTHSADVDQHGIIWTSGFGGVRGFFTHGRHWDPVQGVDRYATATDPIPYAGGSVHSNDPSFATSILEHNSFHVTQDTSDPTASTVTAADGRTFNKEDLQYVTQENVTSCTSTSGGGSGRFEVVNLAGSYNGEDWDPALSASNRFFVETIGDYSAKNNPGSLASGSCSAHWFTVMGDMVAIAFYAQGVRVLDMSDPTLPTQVGYVRIPSVSGGVQSAQNTSAAYWHNGYIYTADYSRGVDVLKFTGEIKGHVQPKICWNSCVQ